MDAPHHEYERENQETTASFHGAADASRREATSRAIAGQLAFLFGALLGGLAALLQGIVALVLYSVRLARVGFFVNGAIAIAFAVRSLFGLLLVVAIVAGMGGLTGAAAACIWRRITDPPRGD